MSLLKKLIPRKKKNSLDEWWEELRSDIEFERDVFGSYDREMYSYSNEEANIKAERWGRFIAQWDLRLVDIRSLPYYHNLIEVAHERLPRIEPLTNEDDREFAADYICTEEFAKDFLVAWLEFNNPHEENNEP